MVYRYKPSKKEHLKREKKPYRRAGTNSPRRLYGYRADAIDLETLFEIAKLCGATENAPKKKSARERATERIRDLCASVRAAFASFASFVSRAFVRAKDGAATKARSLCSRLGAFIEKRRQRRRGPSIVPTLAGALVGTLVICLISAFAVFYRLIISEYFGSYETVVIPDMVGMSYASAKEELDTDSYNVTVSYEYSADVPTGEVLSQSPAGGTQRKVFLGGSRCTISVVVSRGKEIFTMSDYVGMKKREALLELKNMGARVSVVEEYSDRHPAGHVISTTPRRDESFSSESTVVLRVSLGKEKVLVAVPDVRGLTENAAVSLLLSSGFVVGEISYTTSSEASGRVIEQSIAPHTSAEYGSEISFTVSAGQGFDEKKMPSLYGLTLSEAKDKLAEYGLVCGNIYAVDSSEPSGRVVAQTPLAGGVITSTTLTVDIYVSK